MNSDSGIDVRYFDSSEYFFVLLNIVCMHSFIETLISLVGLYIIFSIVNSSIVEVFIQMLNERGKFLKKSLENFFDQAKGTPNRMVDLLYDSKLFKAYAKKNKLPDYIDKRLFSRAMMEILFLEDKAGEKDFSFDLIDKKVFNGLSDDLKKTLRLLLIKANDQVNEKFEFLQIEIETLFDTYMQTVTYWYQKKSKIIMGITGFALALLLNLNSIHIYNVLKTDSELRRGYVELSTKLYEQKDHLTVDTAMVENLLDAQNWNSIEKDSVINILIGAVDINGKGVGRQVEMVELDIGFLRLFKLRGMKLLAALLGCLLTGLALSFGSTFWFTILKKMVGK